jgi:hypothetical protein
VTVASCCSAILAIQTTAAEDLVVEPARHGGANRLSVRYILKIGGNSIFKLIQPIPSCIQRFKIRMVQALEKASILKLNGGQVQIGTRETAGIALGRSIAVGNSLPALAPFTIGKALGAPLPSRVVGIRLMCLSGHVIPGRGNF